MKELYAGALENSFAVVLAIAMAGIIAIMMGSLSFTTMQQMAVIMATMYSFCRLYQHYRKEYCAEYSLLGGKNLEKLFVVLTIFIMSVALFVDICSVARL